MTDAFLTIVKGLSGFPGSRPVLKVRFDDKREMNFPFEPEGVKAFHQMIRQEGIFQFMASSSLDFPKDEGLTAREIGCLKVMMGR